MSSLINNLCKILKLDFFRELVLFFQIQEGTNKQTVATLVEISQDGGYVGVGWEGRCDL